MRPKAQPDANRCAIVLDVENVIYDFREDAQWEGAGSYLVALVEQARGWGTVVSATAACDHAAAARLSFPLSRAGVRTFTHAGGPDAADEILMRALMEVPASCDTVVICSGDHCFAEPAATLRAAGKRVLVMSLADRISADLYRAADDYVALTPGHSRRMPVARDDFRTALKKGA